MDIFEKAFEIHRRRLFTNSAADPAQALGEALIHNAYQIELSLENFSDPSMSLNLRDGKGQTVALVACQKMPIIIPADLLTSRDIVIVAMGTKEACDILGWIRSSSVEQSTPVSEFFLREMPDEFLFPLDGDDAPRIWDYKEQGWMTINGVGIYDPEARNRIYEIDRELSES